MLNRGIVPILLLTVALSVSGCATSSVHVDPALASRAEPMSVRRSSFLWREGLSFGPFQVRLSSGIPWEAVSGDLADAGLASQGHRFDLRDGDARVQATCRTRNRKNWIMTSPYRPPLVQCAVRSMNEEESWKVTILQDGTRKFKGWVEQDGTGDMQIESVHRREPAFANLEEPTGYAIRQQGVVVAAVENRSAGRVWIDPALSRADRLRAATAVTSLLLFNPADDE